MRGFSWFPAIGAVIGGWAAVWFDAAIAVWPEPAVAACLSTSATVRAFLAQPPARPQSLLIVNPPRFPATSLLPHCFFASAPPQI